MSDIVTTLLELQPVLLWHSGDTIAASAGTNWVSVTVGDGEPVRIRGSEALTAFRTQLQRLLGAKTERFTADLTPELSVTFDKGDFAITDSLTLRAHGGTAVYVEGFTVFNLFHDLLEWLSLLQDGACGLTATPYRGATVTPTGVVIHQEGDIELTVRTPDRGRLCQLFIDAIANRTTTTAPVFHNGDTPVTVTRVGVVLELKVGLCTGIFSLSAGAHLAAALSNGAPLDARIGPP